MLTIAEIQKAKDAAVELRRIAEGKVRRPDGTTVMRDNQADALADLAETVLRLARDASEKPSVDRDGWTGKKCPAPDCHGGEVYDSKRDAFGTCKACGGTGDEYIDVLDERP